MGRGRVRYYAQTTEFSCGAACLLMALHKLRRHPFTRAAEFGLWREATMIGIPGIDKWGLTLPALRRKVRATVVSPTAVTFARMGEAAKAYGFTDEEIGIAEYIQRENRKAAQAAGAGWERAQPRPDRLARALRDGALAVLLVDLGALGGDPVPHWILATGMQDGVVEALDPDPDGPGRRRLTVEEVWKAMDVSKYNARPAMVLLGP